MDSAIEREATASERYLAFGEFDPAATTLQHSPLIGDCLRSRIHPKWTTCIKDASLPCRSGDLVALLIRRRNGEFTSLVKELRVTRDGRWFGVCDDAAFRLGWGGIYWPAGMTRLVALSSRDFGLDSGAAVIGATRAELDRINAMPDVVQAVAEWAELGVPRGVVFPGLIAINPTYAHRSRMDDNVARLLADLPTDPHDLRNGTGARPVCATVSTPSYDQPIAPTNLTATGLVKGVILKWDAPSPRNNRQVCHLYQHTANTPFASATRVWSGNALHTTVDLTAGVTRFFWVTSELNGQETSSVPSGNGVPGTPGTANTADITNAAATDVGSVVVNQDVHNFPSAVGVQDRTFTEFTYTNTNPDAVTLEVSVTGVRIYTTPAGLSGTADAVSRIIVRNITDSLSVGSTQDWLPNQIENQAANASQLYTESTVFTVQVPAGKQYGFQPLFRSLTNVGSTGTLTVETLGYTMRVTAIKK